MSYCLSVEIFINAGCSVNRQDTNGYTALHVAVEMGYEKISQLLLQHRANVNAMDNYGICPLHLAARRGDLSKYFDFLLQGYT